MQVPDASVSQRGGFSSYVFVVDRFYYRSLIAKDTVKYAVDMD
jgi:hypothetical protein